ncbi:MFS polyamine transporter [Peniophora sp. CONT]|nr:MFS polyamine transporter [Peniophora sp. CONT]
MLTSPEPTASTFSVSSGSTLGEEILRDEQRIEEYRADDPEEPPVKSPTPVSPSAGPSTSAPRHKQEHDPNLVRFEGSEDMENPHNWSRKYRWYLTLICSLLTVNVTFASSAPTSSSKLIVQQFGISVEVVDLVTSLFLFGYCVGPIFWGPGSEVFGRRPVFILAMTSYSLLILGQALAHNTATLLVTRFLSGVFACAPLTNAGGVIVDIWDPVTRGTATSLFVTMVFLGPVLGPLLSGFIVERTDDFRWVFWVMFIFAAVCSALAVAFIPETYGPRILELRARRLRKEDPVKNKGVYAEVEKHGWDLRSLLDRTINRPFKMLGVELILILVTIYMSVIYGVLYGLFEAIPIIFSEQRGFTVSQIGLVFIGVGVGVLLSCVISIYTSRKYPALVKEWRGFPPPENRLYGAMVAGPAMVIGAFWLGWTGAYPDVHWAAPAVSLIFIGTSVTLVFISFISYLVDTYLMYAASALAANTIARSAGGAAFPLFTAQMYHGMGIQWASTLIGVVALVLAPIPFLFYKYGARIRASSKFAPGVDLKIAAEIAEEKASAEKFGDV